MSYLILILAFLVNFLLSLVEQALVSARRARLEGLAERGSEGAKAALELQAHPSRYLSVGQAGITLAAILSGSIGERSLASDLERWMKAQGFFGGNPQAIDIVALVGVTLVITYVTLVFAELVPKRLGMSFPEQIACAMARPMRLAIKVSSPVVALLAASTEVTLRAMGLQRTDSGAVTSEEIRHLIDQGREEGVIHETEQQLVERVFQLSDQSVSAMMVPRTEIAWLRVNLPPTEVARIMVESNRSHYPVCEGDLEHPVGVVHVKDIANAAMSGDFNLRLMMKPPVFVPESMPVLRVMEEFSSKKTHIAFVLDEYGGLAGLITFNDIVAAVMGQAAARQRPVEDDPAEVTRGDGSMLLDGLLPVARVRELTGEETLPKEDAGFNTLAGLLMTNLGKVPRAGDVWEWDGHRFEVMDMDGRRVDKVLYVKSVRADEGELGE
jgi:putative hemolysin